MIMIDKTNILLILLILVFTVVFSILKFKLYRFFIKKPHPQRRQFDVQKLSKYQKKGYEAAKELYKKGMIIESARLLESVGLIREAITLLDKNGKVHEAANILLKMQRPNRAGMIYIKHGKWAEAFECFKLAGMWPEAAKCARELGKYEEAAKYFLDSNDPLQAAECYFEGRNYRQAALIYAKLGMINEAIHSYENLVNQLRGDLSDIHLEDFEAKLILDYLSLGNDNTTLADLLAKEGHLEQAVLNLIKKDELQKATALYLRTTKDIGSKLISTIDYNDKELMFKLAEVFVSASNFFHAGIVYEKLNELQKAAECFEKAQDYQRAVLCYDKLNNKAKVAELRSKLALIGTAPVKSFASINKKEANSNNSPFVLDETEENIDYNKSENQTEIVSEDQDSLDDENKTQIVSLSSVDENAQSSNNSALNTQSSDIANNDNVDNLVRAQDNLKNIFNLNLDVDKTNQDNNGSYNAAQVQTNVDNALVDKNIRDILFSSPIFDGFNQKEQEIVLKHIKILDVSEQEQVNISEGFYILIKGDVELVEKDSLNHIKDISCSECFGYEKIFVQDFDQYVYLSLSDSVLAFIAQEDINLITTNYSTIAFKIYKNLISSILNLVLISYNNSQKSQAALIYI